MLRFDDASHSEEAPETLIRKARRSDLPDLSAMIHALASHHGDRATVGVAELERDLLGPRPWATALVAEAEEGLLGYALLCPFIVAGFGRRGMELHHLLVIRQARGRGLGQRMMKAVVDEALAQGCHSLVVGTQAANLRAQEFYEGLGFERAPPSGPRFRATLSPP